MAFNVGREWPSDISNVSGSQLLLRTHRLITDTPAIQKCSGYLRLNCEIHILRNVARESRNPQSVELRRDNAHKMAASIKKRSTAITRLHRSTYLKIARVITKSCEGVYDSD
jgi:hypothetical protein